MKIAWEKWLPSDQKVVDDGWDEEEKSEYEQMEQSQKDVVFSQLVSLDGPQFGHQIYQEKDFNLWIGHSDFTITPKFLMGVADYPGIESVDPISRYRFRVGIGKLFIPRDVLSSLSKKLDELM